jgi:hypothetical protein
MPVQITIYVVSECREILIADQQLYSLATHESIEAAGSILGRRVEPNVENLAGVSPVWREFKRELRILFCTDEGYPELRKQIQSINDVTKTIIVPVIAVAIEKQMNLEAGLAIPFVALAILGVAQLGTQAWCKTVSPDGVPSFKVGSLERPIKIESPEQDSTGS